MEIVFENRVTEAGRNAILKATNYVAQELHRARDTHGERSPEALQCLLALISIEQIVEPDKEVHGHIVEYIDVSKPVYGLHSDEVANGLFLLGWSHAGLEREEEAGIAFQQSSERPGGNHNVPPIEPMLEALCGLLDKIKESPGPEDARIALVLGVHTLSWLVTHGRDNIPEFAVFVDRIRPVLEARGYRNDLWAWLMRRCDRLHNDFAGLISVLLEERLIHFEPEEWLEVRDGDSEREYIVKGYEISGIKSEHWLAPEGFSDQFPVSVAEGELSLRVERLLAEGCRYLSAKGSLETGFLIFSQHFAGRRITAFGTTTWSDEERTRFQDEVRKAIAEHGADSAMMLAWVDRHRREAPDAEVTTTEAVMVVARDAKSYLIGLQPVHKIDGRYVFDEPIVRVAHDDWFSEFTFPVLPSGKQPRGSAGNKSNR